jgi:hypothetical protein
VSLVVYPSLKRLSKECLPRYFKKINNLVSMVSLVGLALYCPMFFCVELVFPQYEPLLAYLNLLFLSVIGQVKMQLLNNTYYKTLRMERRLFTVNLEGMAFMLVVGGVSYLLIGDVRCIAAATALTMLVRSWLSERELAYVLGVWSLKRVGIEVLVCCLFLAVSMMPGYAGPVAAFILCVICAVPAVLSMRGEGGTI